MQTIKTFALAFAAVAAFSAQAGIVSVGGEAVNLDSNPGSFNFGDFSQGVNQSDSSIWAFTESSDLKLGSDLLIDVALPGTYTSKTALPLVKPIIAAGTMVDSTMLYSDPLNQPKFFSGSVTFDGPILGVELLSSSLSGSDWVSSLAGTTYPTLDGARGMELGDHPSGGASKEGISFSGSTLTFDAYTHDNVDEIRVITAAQMQAVPEPGGLVALAIGALGLIRRRKLA